MEKLIKEKQSGPLLNIQPVYNKRLDNPPAGSSEIEKFEFALKMQTTPLSR